MYQEEVKVSYGEGRYQIHISSIVTADGISITLTGGEKPHVGGMAVCVPRKSLSGDQKSFDTWIIPVPGHKDTEAATLVAKMVCLDTGMTSSVTAGIHIDKAEKAEIEELLDNSRAAAQMLCEKIKRIIGD